MEFHDVSFAYEKDILVLKHVNFHVKQGESVALVGHTGQRKNNHHQPAQPFLQLHRRPGDH